MRPLKINRLLPIYISILPLKLGVDVQSQTKVSPEIKKSNMAIRRPFWKWRHWKSIGSYPYIQVLCHLSLELIFEAKLKLESGNQKIQYGCLVAILKLTLLKINRLPAISRADSTDRSHRMPYDAARPNVLTLTHPPWAQLHAIINYHGSISTLHTWEIVCK